MPPSVTIISHTTASVPRPHILYSIQVNIDGKRRVVDKRYSEFVQLHDSLHDPFTLPPKRFLVTTFIPSAWVDDALVAERKTGLASWLRDLLSSDDFKDNSALLAFLTPDASATPRHFSLEDVLPSTLSRKAGIKFTPEDEVDTMATPIAAAYYPDWSAGSNPPEKIDFSKFDILFFAFAMPNSSSTLTWDSGAQDILRRLVTSARNSGKGTKIVLSVGGWGGSTWFSQAMSSSANRTTFKNSLTSAVNSFGLDGVDIDWEYPNSTGAGNPHSSADAANLLSFFQTLRGALGASKILSAAVPHLPWLGANGQPLTNVSSYAAQLTYVNIMNYDVWGASSNPGPNAPLGNLCGTSSQPQASAQAALAQWKNAGFPANKLLLGLPLYGYVSQSTRTGLSGSLMPSEDMLLLQEANSPADASKREFLNGAHARPKEQKVSVEASGDLNGWFGQQIPFNSLVASGALVKKSDGTYGQGAGYTMAWDDCSDTPFLYNVSRRTVVTYDDTWSLGDKALFAKQNGMAGCFTWSLDQDDGVTLQNVIRKNLGK
ncbi:hypothetical protein PC9H_011522 [Pleurotus ostreatus]|uniref:Chitinase n=1 Tax=Pleurotus ostreatus TaxID=5322 RepID=A0A8H7DN87_PLEOS|nr:uncharacterized protein PC9H_011522 [Pleurotus ostreatus]KAF7421003.1 hypothetical protein PC9H_011522 [Pleurotus ostreatus]KAJ8690497.1 hypothetical protein PTI98_011922 [Pleurotus ostreatus]